MVKFYIELTDRNVIFRLQSDKTTWLEVTLSALNPNDFTTNDPVEIINLQEVNSKIIIGGKTWKLNPTSGTLGEKGVLDYHVYATRDIFPNTPSLEQLESVIMLGNDKVTNSLILNIKGMFELRPFRSLKLSIDDPTIVLRHETSIAGNGYVGKKASKDKDYLNSLYSSSLYYWLRHLKNGTTNMYSDYYTPHTTEELLQLINDERSKF